ncbi:hypothetical protein [Mesorhizobium sp. CAU 1741]|uniref:hypothetical protein n=1 Tax=Mesorhizobium sp. CAU 1741 TaxID=3140366 RepID=UPI00325BE34A
MIVGGFPLAAAPSRSAGSSLSMQSVRTTSAPASAEEPGIAPAHFRTISTIGYGSLASAYQVMKAQETTSARPAATQPAAILSGAGIPTAMSAYEEVKALD